MPKLTVKIAIPIILAGFFVIAIFAALKIDYANSVLEIIVISLLGIFVFSFGLATGQNLFSPIKKILNNATELSRGNLSSRIYLDTKDELAELANTLNKIAGEMRESYEQESGARKSIDIKVRARTQELEETIYALEQKIKNRTIELEKLQRELNNFKKNA